MPSFREGETTLRSLVLPVVALTTVLVGCTLDPKTEVIGTWKVDLNSMEVPEGIKNGPRGQLIEQMKQEMAKARLQFKADGTLIPSGFGSQSEGKWSLDGDRIILVDKSGNPDQNMRATLSKDASKIHMAPVGAPAGAGGFDLVRE
jgi:hypothetical protein